MKIADNNCEICQNKGFNSDVGVICLLTKAKPPIEFTCSSFEKDAPLAKDIAWRNGLKEKEERITRVKKRLTIGFIAFLLIIALLILRAIGIGISRGVGQAFGSFFH